MLIRFKLENFTSYEKETVFELVASGKYQTHPDHESDLGSVKLLKYGVLFGPNASGKSKLVDAFLFFKGCLLFGLDRVATSELFCKNKAENKARDTSFEIQFSIGECFYAYGFSVHMSKRAITKEWLYSLGKTGIMKPIFIRDDKGVVEYTPQKQLLQEEANRFKVYKSDFEGDISHLFLYEMNRNKKLSPTSKLAVFNSIFTYLINNIVAVTPNTPVTNFQRYYNSATLEKVNQLIQTLDTGISEIIIDETSMDEIKKLLSEQVLEDFEKDLVKQLAQANVKEVNLSMRIGQSFFNISGTGMSDLKVTTLHTKHKTSPFSFMFEEESDGTQRLFELLDILLSDKDDCLFIIDELDRSLHPMLTRHFIQEFMKRNNTSHRQLVFTTHEPYIMDQKLFRLDEIWFVDKNSEDASFIYSLDRFKERTDKKISKTYLEGRYGAVPIFSELNDE